MIPYGFPQEVGASRLYIGTGAWIAVDIPESASLLHVLLHGEGGNGADQPGGAPGSGRAGGAGGGSGAITRVVLPTLWLPAKRLFLSLPPGGTTTPAYLSFQPSSAPLDFSLLSADNGNAGVIGTGGTGGTAMAANSLPWLCMGPFISIGGQQGSVGGIAAGAVGANLTFGATGAFSSGGTGGAGCTIATFAGGNIATRGPVMALPGGAAGAGRGSDGDWNFGPIPFAHGGSGGGSSNTVVGGAGGRGAPGCGGGGAGAGTGGTASGGKGGPAFALISWS